jgi:hypothetical protein
MASLAASCAKHVEPLFELFWPGSPQQHRNAVAFAVRLAATASDTGVVYVNEAEEAALAAVAASKAAAEADTGTYVPDGPAYSAHVAQAAAFAADASDAAFDGDIDRTAESASDCLRAAANAVGAATKAGNTRFIDKFLLKANRELLRLKSQPPEAVWSQARSLQAPQYTLPYATPPQYTLPQTPTQYQLPYATPPQ